MSKRVFVTGAAGFIGFHVTKSLFGRGDQVLGFDNFNPYYDPALKRARAEALPIEIIEGNIGDLEVLRTTVKTFQPTHILHLAAQAGVRHCLTKPEDYLKSNLEGFLNILEISRAHPEVKLIYASSSSVYGANKKLPFAAADRTDLPSNLYGATKKSNELMAEAYHQCFGISVTGLRYFTVYGPWGRPDMAYYSFTDAISEGRPIELFNNGEMERDFTYIDDIVDGTIAAIDLGAERELFNLGNNQPVQLMDFVKTLERHLGKKAIIDYLPMQTGEVVATCADIEHSKEQLGFAPRTSLDEGLEKFVQWYSENASGKCSQRSVATIA